jgi:stage V sporulation protein AA
MNELSAAIAPTLYVRLRKRVRIRKGSTIVLGQVAQLIAESEYEEKLRRLPLYQPRPGDGDLVLIDMLLIVRKVKEQFPDMQVEHFGEPHTLVELVTDRKKPSVVRVALVWVLLFIGSGLAIMNFHADVSMMEVHRRIYELVTGRRVEHPLILQIPYSFGLGAGMVIFFNHLFKKKFNEEPSPLEVEMFLYEENVNRYIITEEYGKIGKKDDSG